MIPLEEARHHVLSHCRGPGEPWRAESIHAALGHVLAEDVTAGEAVPPFDNAAMDGFAVRLADVAGATETNPVRLLVTATTAAGDPPAAPITAGTTVRIMTGAPMPDGAEAVVPVEASRRAAAADGERADGHHRRVDGDHERDDGGDEWIELLEEPARRRHIRPAGDDVTAGERVLPAGTVLSAAHLGVLSSLRRRHPLVQRVPTVAVISTGDELVDDDELDLAPGQIRESNRPTLVAALRGWGFDAADHGTLPDDPEVLGEALRDLAGSVDAIVSSGGVSMGDFDVVRMVLEDVAEMRWMQIAIRPAKPFAFGMLGETPVFGLPGNPVSALVSAALLAVPGLRKMAGRDDLDLPRVQTTAAVDLPRRPDPRTTFLRVDCRPDGGNLTVTPVGAQGSHQLAATAGANALAILPPGDGHAAGETVQAVLLRDPFGP